MSKPGSATPQLTVRAVILAVILAMILSAANAYLGLFAGLTIATAIPAAVVSMGVLRLLGGGTILENNIVQTGASAGSSIAAGRDLHHPGADHPRLLAGLPIFLGARHRRSRRPAGRVVLGAAAALDDRRRPAAVPGRQGRGRSAEGRREPRPRPEDPRVLGHAWRADQGRRRQRHADDPGHRRRRRLLRQVPGLHGHQPVAGAAGRGLHRRPEHRHRGAVSGSILSWHIAIPIYHAFFLDTDPALAAQHRRRRRGRHRLRDLVDQDPLSRRRCDADRRRVDVVLAAQVAAVRRSAAALPPRARAPMPTSPKPTATCR